MAAATGVVADLLLPFLCVGHDLQLLWYCTASERNLEHMFPRNRLLSSLGVTLYNSKLVEAMATPVEI